MGRRRVVALFLALTAVGTACGPEVGIDGTGLDGQNTVAAHETQCSASNDASAPATGGMKLDDPSGLPACDNPACAGAHCVPAGVVPDSAKSALASCSGGFCVPDALIKSGGAKPPSCKSIGDADGVCLSICVPQVAQYKDVLPQATCAADERCAPCISPMDGKPSGACDIGGSGCSGAGDGGAAGGGPACPHTGPPVLDPNTLPACGGANSGAHCLQTGLVPSAMTSQLATCPGGYCVPDKFIAAGGNFIPATCSSVGNAEGRCENTVLPQVGAQASLPRSSCDANERCAPCTNPLDGKDTGACRISCDPGPKGPPVVFKDCCSKGGRPQGKCVPQSSVPSDQQKNLAARDCPSGQDAALCVPTENLDPAFHPAACTGHIVIVGDYTGVCVSDCVNFGIAGLVLDQGSCDAVHTCAPCKDPITGNPTGAPGCN